MKVLIIGFVSLCLSLLFDEAIRIDMLISDSSSAEFSDTESIREDTIHLDWRDSFRANRLKASNRTYDIIQNGAVKGRMVYEKIQQNDRWLIRDTSELFGQVWETLSVDFNTQTLESTEGTIALEVGEKHMEGEITYQDGYVYGSYVVNDGNKKRMGTEIEPNGMVRPLIFALPEAFDLQQGQVYPAELFAFSSGERWKTELIVEGQEEIDWYGEAITTWKLFLRGGKVENNLYITIEAEPRLLQVDVLGQDMKIVLQPKVDFSDFYNPKAYHYNTDKDSIGIQGYDLVAYHQEEMAVKGSATYQTSHDGITYQFASAENKDVFEKSPEQYLPAYGGYCAYGLGMEATTGGYKPGKFPINPRSFKLIDGKLYLFYDAPNFNALEYWEVNEKELKRRADQNWLKIGRRTIR